MKYIRMNGLQALHQKYKEEPRFKSQVNIILGALFLYIGASLGVWFVLGVLGNFSTGDTAPSAGPYFQWVGVIFGIAGFIYTGCKLFTWP